MIGLLLGLVQDADYQKSLAWVERQVARVERGPGYADGDYGARYFAALDALDAAEAVLAKYGPRPETQRVLGRVHFELGNYAEATIALEEGGLPQRAVFARQFGAAKTSFEASHPKRVVAHMVRLGDRWVIAHGDRQTEGDDPVRPFVNVRMSVMRGGKNLFTTANLKRPDWDESEMNEASLYVRDLDKDGKPEVVMIGVFYGASWTPSFLQVLSETPSGWRVSNVIHAHDPLWIDDLDRDGRLEVGGVNVIGMTLSHAAQPRWPEIYRFQKGHLVRSDSKYPSLYRPLQKEIDGLLKEHKYDWELLAFRGRCARILGRASEAPSWERRAIAAFQSERKRDSEWPAAIADYLRDVVRKDEVRRSERW